MPLFFISPYLPKHCRRCSIKKGNVRALWEVSRKQIKMTSNLLQTIATAQKNQKKENAQDIISMSIERLCVKKSKTIEKVYDRKFGFTIGYTIGSKSKM